jgi:branched-chain amino acid transport system ATP-binding protein
MSEPILAVDDIHTYYGESHILYGVSLELNQGELVGLLGRNGAGKTTLLRSICGHSPPRQGSIRYWDEDITGLEPYEIAQRGIGWIPQERRVFPTLTVRENLELADRKGENSVETAFEYFPQLRDLADSKGQSLSGGEQQMLSIARGFLGDFDLLLIDEPTEGLAPIIIENVLEAIDKIKQEVTILLVEQNLKAIEDVPDRYYVLSEGRIAGETEDLDADQKLVEKHLEISR